MTGRPFKLSLMAFGFTFLGLVMATVFLDHNFGEVSKERDRVPTPNSTLLTVEGWRSSALLERDGLALILTGLHADQNRQNYDAKVLAERLGLDGGQAYRLEVKTKGGEAMASLWSAVTEGKLSVEDQDGQVAGLLYNLPTRLSPNAEVVRRLFDPARTLEKQHGGRLVFWGRPPGSAVFVKGPGFAWELSPSTMPNSDLPLFVASQSKVKKSAKQ